MSEYALRPATLDDKSEIEKLIQCSAREVGTTRYTAEQIEGALRAVQNPRCQPFPLPQDAYDEWSVIVFTFDPKVMF